jgi:hypothetical protein
MASQIAGPEQPQSRLLKEIYLSLWRINCDRVACCSRILLFRLLSCDLPDFPGDRNRLKRVRRGESFQKLLNLRGLVVFDNHINLSLAR